MTASSRAEGFLMKLPRQLSARIERIAMEKGKKENENGYLSDNKCNLILFVFTPLKADYM